MFINTFLPGASHLVGPQHHPSAHFHPFLHQSPSAFWASAAAVGSPQGPSASSISSNQDNLNNNKSKGLPGPHHGLFITDILYKQRLMSLRGRGLSPPRAGEFPGLGLNPSREDTGSSPGEGPKGRPGSKSPVNVSQIKAEIRESQHYHRREQGGSSSQKNVSSSELKFGIDRILSKRQDSPKTGRGDGGSTYCSCSPPPPPGSRPEPGGGGGRLVTPSSPSSSTSPPCSPTYLYHPTDLPHHHHHPHPHPHPHHHHLTPPTRHHLPSPGDYHHQWRTCHPGRPSGGGGQPTHGPGLYRQPDFPGPYSLLGRDSLSHDQAGRQGQASQSGSGGKRKRSWSRAVFSHLQRKGLEKRFEVQKYVTKPDRRQLAAILGLTDAQVKVWFQNRRMKWRHAEEAKRKREEVQKREQLRDGKFEGSTESTVRMVSKGEDQPTDMIHTSDSEEEIQIADSYSDT